MSEVWPSIPLGEVMQHRKEFIQIDNEETYKRCRVQLHANGIVLRDEVTGSKIKTKKQQVVKKNEFLVAEIDAKLGGFGIVPADLEGAIVSSHYFLYQINEAIIDRRFFEYYIRTPAFREQVGARGSTNYAAIRPHHVLEYITPLPPLSEQRRIVGKLEHLASKIEEARGLRDEAVTECEAITKSAARQILVSTDPRITQLSEWLDKNRDGIQTGPFGAQMGKSDFKDSGHPVLTIGNVQYGGLRLEGLKYVTEEKAKALSRFAVREGDILFARMGTVGRCCVVPPDAEGWLINYHIIRVALEQSRVHSRYVHWLIQASPDIEEYLEKQVRGATRQGVNSSIVASLPCRVPPMAEQLRIVEHLDHLQVEVDSLKQLQAQTRGELDALLPSVLDKAFRSEL